jgi:hypothetical protein
MSDATQPLRLAGVMQHAKPLAEFPWSGDIVGMGFFPDEVDLPRDWRWEARSGEGPHANRPT